MEGSPKELFSSNLKNYTAQLLETKTKIRQTSVLRLLVFVLGAGAIYLSTYFNLAILFSIIAVVIIAFGFLVSRHLKLYKQKQWIGALLKVNANEISILKMEADEEYSGKEFIDDTHPFTTDLDIFGKKSLFRLINRASTLSGKKQLAERLSRPLKDEKIIRQRQQAIAELKTKNYWRQEFQVRTFKPRRGK